MADDWLPKIGARIKQERLKRGFTQEALAQRAGVSQNTVGYIERGMIDNPGVSTLRAIADALELPRAVLGVATEEDVATQPEVQHLLYLLSLLPEDRAQWYVERITA